MNSSVATSPKLSLDEVRAKIAKAKHAQAQKGLEAVKDEISDLEAEFKMSGLRETACVSQVKQCDAALEDIKSTLADTKQNREALDAIGEDSAKLVACLEEEEKSAAGKVEAAKLELASMMRDRAASQTRISELKGRLAAAGRPSANATQGPFQQGLYLTGTSSAARGCRDEIRALFTESEKLPFKLSAFDSNAGFHIVNVFAAKVKEWETDRGHLLSEDEATVVRRMLGVARTMTKQFSLGFVDALATKTRPSGFSNWTEYLADAFLQHSRYFDNCKPKQAPPTQKQAEAQPVSAPIQKATAAPVFKTLSSIVVQKPVQKPAKPIKPEKEDADDIVLRLMRESGLLAETRGKRVAVIAGLANRNGFLRDFIEKAFDFAEVRWYDRNVDDLGKSLQNGNFDLLLVFPRWHRGFHDCVKTASAKGVRTLTIMEGNKRLICLRLAKELGYEIGAMAGNGKIRT